MRQTHLHSNWQFSNVTAKPVYDRTAVQYQPWLPATVPGHVHLDLVANGIISDPFLDMNEIGSRWVDECDWAYKTTFEWKSDAKFPNRVLRFDGLDTVAEISLNGSVIGRWDNMFLPLELDVSEALVEGSNHLEVRFSSAVRVGDERRTEYFNSEGLDANLRQFDERAFVRKAQYMSAWDWGPRLISCGIWQPVSLIEFATRITSFTVFQERQEDGSFKVRTETVVEGSGDILLTFGDKSIASSTEAIEEIDMVVAEPILWWPNGMGDQHLYSVSARIHGAHEIHKKIGLRAVSLERKADEIGESFTFVINGVKVWARGANWIPNDSFPARITKDEYRSQIFDCKVLGMNMLRVWGGGLYESEAFYDACDEAGVLVWQDFPYACSYYPDGDVACEIARNEAEIQIKRLRDRTSLAMWCGNNENLMMWQTKWGGELSPPRYYGENIYDRVLPGAIERLDPQRSYIPTSPIGQSSAEGANCNEGKFGDSHYWDVWHGRGDWVHYRDSDTRFSSEFGFASSCSAELWKNTITRSQWDHSSPSVRWHDKTGKEWEKFFGYVTTHYPTPHTLEDWVYYSQLNQRDALRFGIEHWRRANDCQGTLIWQFNDCWPVQSWAVQDHLRLLKPAAYEMKRLFGDQLITLDRVGAEIEVTLVNDGFGAWEGVATLEEIWSTDGSIVWSESYPFSVEAGTRSLLTRRTSDSPTESFLRVTSELGRTISLFAEPKDLRLVPPKYRAWTQEDRLLLSVSGVVIDLVVADAFDAWNLKPELVTLAGLEAITAVNETVTWKISHAPTELILRSLAGDERIPVE